MTASSQGYDCSSCAKPSPHAATTIIGDHRQYMPIKHTTSTTILEVGCTCSSKPVETTTCGPMLSITGSLFELLRAVFGEEPPPHINHDFVKETSDGGLEDYPTPPEQRPFDHMRYFSQATTAVTPPNQGEAVNMCWYTPASITPANQNQNTNARSINSGGGGGSWTGATSYVGSSGTDSWDSWFDSFTGGSDSGGGDWWQHGL